MARPRGSGSLYLQKGSAVWWCKYYRNGKAYRESTGETEDRKAASFLRQRIAEIQTGHFYGPKVERIRVEELGEDFLRDYTINARKSAYAAELRWRVHLKPFFGHLRAVDVTSDLLARYVDARQRVGAQNATINREVAGLKRMFRLGFQATPPKVSRMPIFPRLAERNVRKGFLEHDQYTALAKACANSGLWLRAMLELGRTYGWRLSELRNMRVKQVQLLSRTIRLEPGTTKNNEGREVTMTQEVYALLSQCVTRKEPEDFVFTKKSGRRIGDFRKLWAKACKEAGVPGLLFHDLRRTAARNLRRAGVPEGIIMRIGGWKTRTVFERYAIVTQADVDEALRKLETYDREFGHSFGHSEPQEAESESPPRPN